MLLAEQINNYVVFLLFRFEQKLKIKSSNVVNDGEPLIMRCKTAE